MALTPTLRRPYSRGEGICRGARLRQENNQEQAKDARMSNLEDMTEAELRELINTAQETLDRMIARRGEADA